MARRLCTEPQPKPFPPDIFKLVQLGPHYAVPRPLTHPPPHPTQPPPHASLELDTFRIVRNERKVGLSESGHLAFD